ncbi:hypothetical protein [Microtetraspora niveoalba]|uniref:hypothetical protein n=1 Tax=Microtetraspora niveoalba TaxID=46175 RepID=UPI0008301285|nr:hypothetical protein [Microtetraspora niveoalba]
MVAPGAPALTLDRRGRPLLAGYDRNGPLLAFLACEDDDCARRTTAPLVSAYGGCGFFDLAIGPDGRPRLLWYGRLRPGDDDAYHFLTCADARCSVGA